MHLSPYKSQDVVPAQLKLHIDNTVSVGSFVGVLDKDDDKIFHIDRVLDISETVTTLHYYTTKGKHLCNAKWTPLYSCPNSNAIITVQPDVIDRDHRYYTDIIDTRPMHDSLIILVNIGMIDTLRINVKTRSILKSKKLKHHRITFTWVPH